MTDDLAAFLRTRLSEDEVAAKSWLGVAPTPSTRMLREVAAKRAILELHHGSTCSTLRHLAAIHSDHPDYRDEWKP